MGKFYKNKYFLSIYDLEDNFITGFDNVRELAKYVGTTYESMICQVGRMLSGKTKHFKLNNAYHKLEFINVENEV